MDFTRRCCVLSIAFFCTACLSFSSPNISASPAPLPLLFERASGGYQARNSDMAVRLERDGIEFNLRDAGGLAMRLRGKARRVDPLGVDLSSAKIHYLVGPESAWRRNVEAYNKVVYRGVYRGVDLVFHGSGLELEYDFVVQPEADVSAIQMEWEGGQRLALDPGGGLTIWAGAGKVHWKAPAIYQEEHGKRQRVAGRFRLLGGNRVAFEIGNYDQTRELVIDPALVFSTYLGGATMDRSRGVAVDASGNVYVTGFSESMNFPVTKGAFQTSYAGGGINFVTGDAFLAKYTASGSVVFISYIGGSRDDIGMGIALDSAGNPYITGYTNSNNFPTTTGAYQTTFGGYASGQGFLLVGGDAFVSKFSPDGTKLLYSTYLGGQNNDLAFGIAVDAANNVYVTGTTLSSNFPVTPNAYQTQFAGTGGQENFPLFGNGLSAIVGGDVFVTKLNPANPPASALVYSTLIGGSGDDVASSIYVDAAGNAYVGGYTLSTDYPTTTGGFQRAWGGAEPQNYFFIFGDGFISKLNPTGSALLFSTFIGGAGDDWVSSLAADSAGNVIAAGSTTSLNFPVTAGSFQTTYHGPTTLPPTVDMFFGDAFLLKLKADGSGLIYSTYFGGSGDDCVLALATDPAGNIYLGGFTNSSDFPTTPNAIQKTLAGPGYLQTTQTFGDGFLAEFTSGGAPSYITYLGGTQNDAVASLAVSASATVYLTGMTKSIDFPMQAPAQPGNASTVLKMGIGANAFVTTISGFGTTPGGPSINAVVNATGGTGIAQNTFIEILGQNLAPDKRTWGGSDFVNNQMPTALDGVSLTVNGKPAFIYYISQTQVNALTPLDSTTGLVQVQLKTNIGTSQYVSVQMQAYAPGFYQFLPAQYVAAVHLDKSLIGPLTLYPGATTPAHPNETIVLFGNGFGQTAPAIVNGSEAQSGTLPVTPAIKIGGIAANVQFAGVVEPGLYQFNVVVPGNVPAGDNSIVATFNGVSTQAGALISISN